MNPNPTPGNRRMGLASRNGLWGSGTHGHLSIRLPSLTIERLDHLAAERGVTRSQVVRDGIEVLVAGQPVPDNPLTEEEILALLRERARSGNVSALRALLAREESTDPHQRALSVLQEMAEGRRQ